jgi:glycosyltransferase involved in cell wall biosynthesis
MNKEILDISIVIATLGGPCLLRLIDCINNQSITVKEIIICLPVNCKIHAQLKKFNNINICYVVKIGQVSQRSEGLKIANGKFVIQLDDDMVFSESFIRLLYINFIKIDNKAALSPLIKNYTTKNYLTNYQISLKNILKNIYFFLLAGAPWSFRKMGIIDRGGIGHAVDKNYLSTDIPYEVEWLPGGCVICSKDNLILEDYFPFQGKAYSEDLIHSLLWRQMGVKLYIDPSMFIYTEISLGAESLNSYFQKFKARNYYLKLCHKNKLTSFLYLLIDFFRWILIKFLFIIQKNKK